MRRETNDRVERENKNKELTSWRSSRTLWTYRVSGTVTVEQQKPKDVPKGALTPFIWIRYLIIVPHLRVIVMSRWRTGITKSPQVVQSQKMTPHTEMSMSARLRITFAALKMEDHEDQPAPCKFRRGRSTHHDFQTFPWPPFGS